MYHNVKIGVRQAQWCRSVIPATKEAEASLGSTERLTPHLKNSDFKNRLTYIEQSYFHGSHQGNSVNIWRRKGSLLNKG
jgi:hypothetical protein